MLFCKFTLFKVYFNILTEKLYEKKMFCCVFSVVLDHYFCYKVNLSQHINIPYIIFNFIVCFLPEMVRRRIQRRTDNRGGAAIPVWCSGDTALVLGGTRVMQRRTCERVAVFSSSGPVTSPRRTGPLTHLQSSSGGGVVQQRIGPLCDGVLSGYLMCL